MAEEFYARRPRPRQAGEFPFPAPVRGLNRRDAEADMQIAFARALVNLRPASGYVETRKGSVRHATLTLNDGVIFDTMPPQLASPIALIVREPGVPFEVPLLPNIVAEADPITFSLLEAPDWVRITAHGVLYGVAPILESDRTFRLLVRAQDPSKNHRDFDGTIIVLRRRGTVGAASPITAARPDATSARVALSWTAAPNATHYRLERAEPDGDWEHYRTVTGTAIGVLDFGRGDRFRVRGEAQGYRPGAWTSAICPDQVATAYEESAAIAAPGGNPTAVRATPQTLDVTLDLPHFGPDRTIAEARQGDGGWQVLLVITERYQNPDLPFAGAGWQIRRRTAHADGTASEPSDSLDIPQEKLAAPRGLTAIRFPASYSELALIDFGTVSGATGYVVATRRAAAGLWTEGEEPASLDVVTAPGANWRTRVRAIAEGQWAPAPSDWSRSVPIPDQQDQAIVPPAPDFERLNDRISPTVRVTWAATGGVGMYAYQTRQDGGEWGAAVRTAENSVRLNLPGAGWEFRWAPFTPAAGYTANAAGDALQIPDQGSIGVPSNLAADRHPNTTDATVRVTWSAVPEAAGYQIQPYQNDATSGDPIAVNGQDAVTRDVEMEGEGWAVGILALAAQGRKNSAETTVAVPAQAAVVQDPGPQVVASDLSAIRPVAHEQAVNLSWTPGAGASAQAIEFRQSTGAWVRDEGAGLLANSNSYTTNLAGSSWRFRIVTTDRREQPQTTGAEASVPNQDAVGLWRPFREDAGGSRIYDQVERDEIDNLSRVHLRLERQAPRSGAAGVVSVKRGTQAANLPYIAGTLALSRREKVQPGILVSVEDVPGAGLVAAAAQQLVIPARPAVQIASLGLVRPQSASVTFGERNEAREFDFPEDLHSVTSAWTDGTTVWLGDGASRGDGLFGVTLATGARTPPRTPETSIPGRRSPRTTPTGITPAGTPPGLTASASACGTGPGRKAPWPPEAPNSRGRPSTSSSATVRLLWAGIQRGIESNWEGIQYRAFDLGTGKEQVKRRKVASLPRGDRLQNPGSGWLDGTTIWADNTSNRQRIYAWEFDPAAPTHGSDFVLAVGNQTPGHCWGNGTTVWVFDRDDNKYYAYDLATRRHDPTKDKAWPPTLSDPRGGWIEGESVWLWLTTGGNVEIRKYNLATFVEDATARITVPSDDFDEGRGRADEAYWTISSVLFGTTAHFYLASYRFRWVNYEGETVTRYDVAIVDRATGGHVTDPPYWSSRPESQRGLVWAKDYLWLVDRDGIHAHYPTTTTGSFNRNNGALTMPLVETNDDPRGIVTNTAEDTLWVLDARDRRFYGYPFIPFLPRTENRDVILAADNDQTYALAGADGHLWAFDNADDKGYAYRAAGDATQNATNKNVTLSWRQATDADNRAHYPIRIRRRRAGAANWVAVVPLTMPQFDAATKHVVLPGGRGPAERTGRDPARTLAVRGADDGIPGHANARGPL